MSVRNWIYFGVLSLVWGTSFFWIKIAVTEVSPFVLVGFRTLFGGLSLLVILLLNKQSLRWSDLRPWLGIFVMVGLFNVALPWLLISWSEKTIDSGTASILNSTTPLFTMILAPLMLKDDSWSVPKVSGLILGFSGVVVLMLPEMSHGLDQNLLGYGTMLLGTLSYGFASVYSRRKAVGLAPQVQAFLQLWMASGMAWVVTAAVDRPIIMPALPLTWIALLWLGILGSGFAYILYFSLIHEIGPTRTTMVTYVLPLVAVVLGVVFLGEKVAWQDIFGGLMIILGIAVVNIKFKPFWKTSTQKV
jgi:drug/metabolite transporter (DMT)-like permease